MSLVQVVGVFNIFVGLMLTASMVMMGAGIILWFTRLGTWPTYRDEAIHLMMWAVTILFVLLILMVILNFVQVHTAGAAFIFGLILLAGAAWVVMQVASEGGEEEEKH